MSKDLWLSLRESWLRSLRARNTSTKTQHLYDRAVLNLTAYMRHEHPQVQPEDVRREHVEGFIEAFRLGKQAGDLPAFPPGRAPSTVSLEYRALQQWFKWLVDEDEIDSDPMARMQPPIV